MRVLWTHNSDPSILNAGCFMYPILPGLRDLGVDVHLEYLGNMRSPFNILRARRRIRELATGFDLVHAQYGSACALVTAAVSDRPTVVTIRGSDWNTYDSSIKFLYFHTRFARMMTRIALPSFTGIITVSQRIQRSMIPYAPNAHFLVLPSAIDLGRWKPFSSNFPRNRACTWSQREKKVLFISINPSNPIKRFGLCQEVMSLVNQQQENVTFSVASNIPHAEMHKFVASFDAVLCTSGSEGWPNSIKEALACNIPFVSTDVSDLAEIAAQEPSCRVCAADAGELARNLCEVLQMPRPDNLRRFVEPMGVKISSEKLISFYKSLLRM